MRPVLHLAPRRWLPSKARDLDISPYASPRAASPEGPLPLAIAVHAAPPASTGAPSGAASGFAVSEAGSGSITPAGFSGDDASPRAVLRSASAMLLSHQAAAGRGGGGGGAAAPAPAGVQQAQPNLVRKSLLSASLAPSRRGSCSPPGQQRQARRAASLGAPAAQPAPGTPTAAARLAPQPQLVGAPAVMHHGGSALSYKIASEWQQPAIRTVKMQGQARA